MGKPRTARGFLALLPVLAGLAAGSARAAAPADAPRWILPAGCEPAVLALVSPSPSAPPLPAGFVLGDTQIAPDQVRYRFGDGTRSFELVLRRADGGSAPHSRHFRIALEAADGTLSRPERDALLARLVPLVQAQDRGPDPWRPVSTPTGDGPGPATAEAAALRLGLQLLLGVAVVALLLRIRVLLALARRIPARDVLWLALFTATGAGLRLWGGIRVPGWINGHGYELLSGTLAPGSGVGDPHGLAYAALYELVFLVLPRTELTVIGCQFVMSLACVALVYLLARHLELGAAVGLWAAAALAVLPVPVFFGLTEVHQVPGVFALLLALLACGLAARDRHPAGLVAAVALLALTAQLYPTLMLTPLAAVALAWAAPRGRDLARRPGFWWAAGALALLLALPAGLLAWRVGTSDDIIGRGFLLVLAHPSGMILPDPSFDFGTSGNVWLNPHFTPPTVALAVLAGAGWGVWRAGPRRRVVLALLACGMLCTWVGLVAGRINPARVQLPAAPFFALLAGVGLEELRASLGARLRLWSGAGLAALLAASLVVWPGLLGRSFSPQEEQRVFRAGVARLPAECLVLWPPVLPVRRSAVPDYAAAEAGRTLRWVEAGDPELAAAVAQQACVAYYRPSACYDLSDLRGGPGIRPGPRGLRPECEALEERLVLEPRFVRTIPAAPDYGQVYARPGLEVGFFAVSSVREAPPAAGRP